MNTTRSRPQASPQLEDTVLKIDEALKNFKVLGPVLRKEPSIHKVDILLLNLLLKIKTYIFKYILKVENNILKVEQHVVKYIYCYLGVYFFLLTLEVGISLSTYPEGMGGNILVANTVPLLYSLGLLSIIMWVFRIWCRHVPDRLRDIIEQRRISVSAGDVNTKYLEFLEHYRNALRSPWRYLVIASCMAIVIAVLVYNSYTPQFSNGIKGPLPSHLTLVDVIFSLVDAIYWFAVLFLVLGSAYLDGVLAWTLGISGWNIRKLSREFEFRIEPAHPDNCGGLHMLGKFCIGALLPIVCGFVFNMSYGLITWILHFTPPISVAFIFTYELLYDTSVASFAFFLPVVNIHTKMLRERESVEENQTAQIEKLRGGIQALLKRNQLKEAKVLQEKKAFLEAEYIPYPTWPFSFHSTIFTTAPATVMSILTAVITVVLPEYILHIFHV